jgi:hypothetical protein
VSLYVINSGVCVSRCLTAGHSMPVGFWPDDTAG